MADDQKGLERKCHSSKKKSRDYDKKRENSNEEQHTSITKYQTSYTYPRSIIPHVNPSEILEIGVLKPPKETPYASINQENRYSSSILDTRFLLASLETPFLRKNLEAAFSKSSLGAPFSGANLTAYYLGAGLANPQASASQGPDHASTSRENEKASARQENRYSLSRPGTPSGAATGSPFSGETPGSPYSDKKLATAYSVARLASLRSGKNLTSPFLGARQIPHYSGTRQEASHDSTWANFYESKIRDTYYSTSNKEDLYSFFSSGASSETPCSTSRNEPALPPLDRKFADTSYSRNVRPACSANLEPAYANLGFRPVPSLPHPSLESPSLTSSREPLLSSSNPILEHVHSPTPEPARRLASSDSSPSPAANLEPTRSHPSQISTRSFYRRPGYSQSTPRPEPAHSPAIVETTSFPASLGSAQSPPRPEPAHPYPVQELFPKHPILRHTHSSHRQDAHKRESSDPSGLPYNMPHTHSSHRQDARKRASSDPSRLPFNLGPTRSHFNQKSARSFPIPRTYREKYYRESVLVKFFPITEKYATVSNDLNVETQSKNWPPFIRSWFNTLPYHAQESFLECPLNLQLQLPSWHTNILQKLFSLPKEEMKTAFEKPSEFLKQYFHLSNSMRRKLPLCSLNDFQEINQWLCDHQQQFYTWPTTIRQLFGEWYHSMMEYVSPPFEFKSKVNCKERVTSPFSVRNVAFLGSPRCGRTSLILSVQGKLSQRSEEFHEFNPTIFEREVLVCKKFKKKLRFIDADMTNFFEIYDSVKNSDLVVLCYAVDDIDSFLLAMGKWYNVARKISPKILIFLVGLKCDRRDGKSNRSLDGRPAVPLKVIKNVCMGFGIKMKFECSSFTHQNIKDVGTALESLLQSPCLTTASQQHD